MKNVIQKTDRLFQKIVKIEQAIGAILLLIMLVICFFAVILRYCFNSPWTWSEEMILVMLVGFGYACIAIDVYRDEHVALTGVYNLLPPKGKMALDVFRHLLMGGFFALMTVYAWQVFMIKARKPLPITGFSQGIVFMVQFIAAILMTLSCLLNLVKVFVRVGPSEADPARKEGDLT